MKREGRQFLLDELITLQAAPEEDVQWFESASISPDGKKLAAFDSPSDKFKFYNLSLRARN